MAGLLVACLFVVALASAAEPAPRAELELGIPFFRNFSPREYGAQPQNLCIIQDPRGLIYVGNGDGVLEFDGSHWRLIRVANGTMVWSLAVDGAGRIYVGANGELGALEPDALGRMTYVSWLDRIPSADRGFAEVYRTCVTKEGIVFCTTRRIFRVGAQVQVWRTQTAFSRVFVVGDRLFAREAGRGLLELVGGEWRLLPGGERFADEFVAVILPGEAAGTLDIATRSAGLVRFDGTAFHALPTEVDAIIKRDQLRSAERLMDGTLALATGQSGLYLLDARGRLRTHLATEEGLANNNVVATFADREGGLWLALNNGITRVEPADPITTFTKANGVDSTVLSLHRHGGALFAGLNAGLARLKPERGGNAHFVSLPEARSQTWAFLEAGPGVLVANFTGVYEIREDGPALVRASPSAMTLLRSARDPARVFVGLRNGLAAMRWEAGRWRYEGTVPGIADQTRTLWEAADGRLWGGAYANGVFRVSFAGGSPVDSPRIERFGPAQGLPDLKSNGVEALDGSPVFTTSRGVFRFDEAAGRFAPDPRFGRLFPDGPRLVECFTKDSRGWIWMVSTDEARREVECGAAVPNPDGTYRWEPRPVRALLGSPVQTIFADADGVVWFGGSEGLFRYDPRVPKDYDRPFAALVRRVTGPKEKLFFGGAGRGAALSLAYVDNGLRFEFATTSFAGLEANRFQTRLDGEDPEWSSWSNENYRVYSSLREGSYQFRVRARNAYGTVSEEGRFAFTILPPWYRTWWAYAGYLLLAGAGAEGVFFWRVRALRRKTRLLEADIAERKRMQAALRESEERYRMLFENNPLAMWIHDVKSLRFLAVNESAVQRYGYTREEFLGMSYQQICHEEDIPKLFKWIAEERAEGGSSGELRHRRKDGTVIHVESFSKPLTFAHSVARLVLVNDVTERRLIQDQLLHAQRLESVGMLAAGIAHDLNNVLAPIMMAGPMLRRNLTAPRDLKMLDTIEQSAARGAGLVKQVLGFVHTTSSEFRPTQVKHLLRDIVNVIEETFPKSIRLEHMVPKDLWLVAGNASQIHQVVLNLCVNARDAMPQGGTLRLVAANRRLDAAEAAAIPGAEPGAWLMIEVADSGTGIPPEVLEKIWTPFFTTKEVGKGTGLGLSTVRSIVLGHHGFIELDTKVGRGSTFRVFLPVAAGAAAPALAASPAGFSGGRNELILVVDDSTSIRETIVAIVEESGYRAVACADGVEALAQFTAQPDSIALVITDVDMPRLGGVGLAQALLKMRPGIRILALSGQSSSADQGAGIPQIETLAHEFLPKPFKPEELLAAIRRVLQSPVAPPAR